MCSSVFAVTYTSKQVKTITLQAGYSDVMDVTVTPLASQTNSFMQGMPFNIEESFVQYGETEYGRMVANWSVLSNASFTIQVNAGHLQAWDYDTSSKKTGSRDLPYVLTFFYELGYQNSDGDEISSGEKQFEVYSGTLYDSVDDDDISFAVIDSISSGSYAGFAGATGSIYFQFTEDSSELIEGLRGTDAAEIPSGDYYATVTITLTAIETGGTT